MQQDLKQQTEEILREVYKDGFKEEEVILIEDKESAAKHCQINDVMLSKEIDDATLSLREKVIYMVTVSKPSKGEAVIKLYNKLNNEVLIYEVDCWKHHWRLLNKSNRTDNPPPKIPSNH